MSESQEVDILAFSPHPDDAELGCGGSLILAAENGLRVAIADVTDGERSSRGTPEGRAREKAAAAELLRLCHRFSLGLPDTEIGMQPEHRLALIDIIRQTRPRIVLAPYWRDRHPDHEATARLVHQAAFYAGVAAMGKGTVHRPQSLFHYMIHYPFSPAFVVDISSVWDRKLRVLEAYASQFQRGEGGPHTAISQPGFARFVEARAICFGAMIGASYGEPFSASGPVGLQQLPGLDTPAPPPGALPPFSMFT